MAAKSTVIGAVTGFLAVVVLGMVTFGVGMARESVYTIPGLWRGGIEPTNEGFSFVIHANILGLAGVIVVGMVVGLGAGLVRGVRR